MSAAYLPADAVRLNAAADALWSAGPEPPADAHRGAEVVGEGSDFVVYRGTRVTHGVADAVVVKAPRPSAERPMDALEAELHREHRALAALEHPAIPRAHGLWLLPDGRLGLVRGYLPGVTLTTLIERGLVKNRFQGARRWTPATRAIIAAVGDALAHVHRRGLVHNDLKPDNVVVSKSAPGETSAPIAVGLFDFGVAGADASGGTVHYAAPERLEGRPATVRSDVFSFGVLIYELLSGTRPFPSATTADALLERRTPVDRQPREAAQRAWWAFPPEVRAALSRALAWNPRQRQRSVARLLADLGVTARGGARPWALLATAALATTAVMLVASLWGLPRAGATSAPGDDPACLAALRARAARVCGSAEPDPHTAAGCRAALGDVTAAPCAERLRQLATCAP